jgi:glycosyltransferase involved in cell wall biosynthesis
MLTVLIISNNLGRGGKERQIHEMLQYFNANHMPIQLSVLLREPIVEYDISSFSNIEFKIPEKRLSSKEFIKYVYDYCSQKKIDVVHNWESGTALLFLLVKFFYFKHIKVVDGSLRYSKKFSPLTKKYWVARLGRMLSNKVVANSTAGLKSISYANKKKYVVIENGIDLKRFYKPPSSKISGRLQIGMVASFSEPKDFKTLVLAGIEILAKGFYINFTFIGDGKEKQSIIDSIPEKFKSYFTFTGKVEKPEEYLIYCDIGILLSKQNHSEGLSNSIMEYMAAGLPVICTKTGGNLELVEEGKNGFLIEHENKRELIHKIEFFFFYSIALKQMGLESKSKITENFEIGKVCEKYFKLYTSLV